MDQNVLTPQEVADILKIKKTTVYEMIKRGDLRATKLGKQLRIQRNEVSKYLHSKSSTFILNNNEDSLQTIENTFLRNPLGMREQLQQEIDSSTIILCGQDMLLDIITNKINSNTSRPNILRSYLGSYNGLYAMYQGQVHIATSHLWDAATDSYNLPYVSKLLPGINVRIYHIMKRMQGFYVVKGNPKNINGFKDLMRTDLTYINREKGSGTRILLDSMLSQLQVLPGQVKGYKNEVNSHLAVASLIAQLEGDYGLGTAKACKDFDNLEFIPLKEESYDLIIRETDINHPSVKQIISILQSTDFKKELELLGNYNTKKMGERLL